MDREKAPCLDCGGSVPIEATTCPNCGYDVDIHDRQRFLFGALGMAMSLSVVLAPIGLPLLWWAYRERLAVGGTVTRRAPDRPADHLRRVLRRQLALARPGEADEPRRAAGRAPRDTLDIPYESR